MPASWKQLKATSGQKKSLNLSVELLKLPFAEKEFRVNFALPN